MEYTREEVKEAIENAYRGIMFYRPFLAHHMVDMHLEVDSTRAKKIGAAACTDGFKHIWFDTEEFTDLVNNISKSGFNLQKFVGAVIIHEVTHRIFMHTVRGGKRHHFLWNIAADFYVHKFTKTEGFDVSRMVRTKTMDDVINEFKSLFKGGKPKKNDEKNYGLMYDPSLENQRSEWGVVDIYDYIYKNLPQEMKDIMEAAAMLKNCGVPMNPEDIEGIKKFFKDHGVDVEIDFVSPGETESDKKNIEDVLKSANSEALKFAKEQGYDTYDYEGIIEVAEKAKVPWWKYLEQFVTAVMARDDWSYRRVSRRFGADPKIIRPGRLSEKFGNIACIVDVSGSMSDQDLKQIAAEIKYAVKRAKPEKIFVVYADTEVKKVDEFGIHDEITFKRYGCGGTSFIPAFEHVVNKLNDVDVIILFTDGYGDFPRENPGIPTFFADTDGSMGKEAWPRWGKYVRVEI